MTAEKAIEIIKNECVCVMKAAVDNCNRECGSCELVKPTNEILDAMCMAMTALGQEENEEVYERGFMDGFDSYRDLVVRNEGRRNGRE